MENKSFIIILIFIAVFCLGAIFWYFSHKTHQAEILDLKNYYNGSNRAEIPNNSYKTEIPENSEACGLETCHGLDVVCGPNPAKVCSMMYGIGDKCLQYAKCGIQNGVCQQIQNLKFTECKTCVQNCIDMAKDDNAKLFECESLCN